MDGLRCGGPVAFICAFLGFISTKPFLHSGKLLRRNEHIPSLQRTSVTDQQISLLRLFQFLCSIFLQILQSINKWGIRAFLRDIGVNLAFKLHKTHENNTKNANKIHTYQTPPNLTFFLSSSKETTYFPYSKLISMLSMKLR